MSYCKFYLITSKKSEEELNGLKKITFGSENRIDSLGFIWIDNEENIVQMQFIFGEIVLEWFPKKGIIFSKTNRSSELPEGIGYQKGVRILHPVKNSNEIKIVLEEVKNAFYPKEWAKKILEKF